MKEMRRAIARLNIENYERLLAVETDAARARTLKNLLAEARSELTFLAEEASVAQAEKSAAEPPHEAERLRMRAEEYRAVAEATQNDGARTTYLYLARSYEILADRAERKSAGGRKSKVG